jgi:hypothetical protein
MDLVTMALWSWECRWANRFRLSLEVPLSSDCLGSLLLGVDRFARHPNHLDRGLEVAIRVHVNHRWVVAIPALEGCRLMVVIQVLVDCRLEVVIPVPMGCCSEVEVHVPMGCYWEVVPGPMDCCSVVAILVGQDCCLGPKVWILVHVDGSPN